jgi:hypothetical protein
MLKFDLEEIGGTPPLRAETHLSFLLFKSIISVRVFIFAMNFGEKSAPRDLTEILLINFGKAEGNFVSVRALFTAYRCSQLFALCFGLTLKIHR